MKILYFENIGHTFTVIPRVLPNDGDTLVVKMRNEITNVEEEIANSFSYINNYFTLTLADSAFFQLHNKYELTILRNNSIIFRGKAIVISVNDSVQNYKKTEIIGTKKKLKF